MTVVRGWWVEGWVKRAKGFNKQKKKETFWHRQQKCYWLPKVEVEKCTGGIYGDGRRLWLGGINWQYNIQMMNCVIVHLKPIFKKAIVRKANLYLDQMLL